jgi:hypothetical protein
MVVVVGGVMDEVGEDNVTLLSHCCVIVVVITWWWWWSHPHPQCVTCEDEPGEGVSLSLSSSFCGGGMR